MQTCTCIREGRGTQENQEWGTQARRASGSQGIAQSCLGRNRPCSRPWGKTELLQACVRMWQKPSSRLEWREGQWLTRAHISWQDPEKLSSWLYSYRCVQKAWVNFIQGKDEIWLWRVGVEARKHWEFVALRDGGAWWNNGGTAPEPWWGAGRSQGFGSTDRWWIGYH